MISVIAYGLTLGGILYIISIGFSFTFGTMKIVNYAHALIFTIGGYILYATLPRIGFYPAAVLAATLGVIPIAFIIERFVIRNLYGESVDLTIIATYAVFLIGLDVLKWIWGSNPLQMSDPINKTFTFLGTELPVYRMAVIVIALALAILIEIFLQRSMAGKIVIAGLEDKETVRGLGISVQRYFTMVFIIGSALAALGGVLYAPITVVEPYMGFQILMLSFAVVIVGGLGNWRGTFVAAFFLGMVMSVTGRWWGPASEVAVFAILAVSLLIHPIDI
ncbi:MAG: branched-chain amino acid ABC transporter permease [Planctomycetota bacterium]|jgi:branched-subunit amino acid ABC-type transport system permease component|nr:branched-chain amino acid ABC transporter permease [Planctomycetota bacterium]